MDHIEMWWKCTACGTINGGLSKSCGERVVIKGKLYLKSGKGCGKPLDHKNWFMPKDISKQVNITNNLNLNQAREGEDWSCKYCGSTQRNSLKQNAFTIEYIENPSEQVQLEVITQNPCQAVIELLKIYDIIN